MVSASCSYYSSTYGSSPHEFVPRDGRRGIAIVASTLLIAGLVQPVRGFLLRSVDRRFHRAKYGAEKTLTAFRAGLLHEVRNRFESYPAGLAGTDERASRRSMSWLMAA
jgi:hypothetical protein